MVTESVTLWAAIIAAVAAVSSTVVSAMTSRSIRRREELFAMRQESGEFLREKISKLYMPVAMRIRVTGQLFDRFFASTTTSEEKTAIEHAMREYNKAIQETLMAEFAYLEPDAPKEATTDLMQHLIQWENVYRLKYEYGVYDGPVFAGIKRFGYQSFPPGADEYFIRRTEELRDLLHTRTN